VGQILALAQIKRWGHPGIRLLHPSGPSPWMRSGASLSKPSIYQVIELRTEPAHPL
jgi:hypothetical protein